MTPDDFLSRIRGLAARGARPGAARAERLRRLPDETFADFQQAGLFRAMQPKRHGGFEIDPGRFYQGVTEIAAVWARPAGYTASWPPITGIWGCFRRRRSRMSGAEDDSIQNGDIAGAHRHDRARSRRLPGQRTMVVRKRLRFLSLGSCSAASPRRRKRGATRSEELPAAAFRLRDRRQLARHGAVRHRQQGYRRAGRLRAGLSHAFLSRRSHRESRHGANDSPLYRLPFGAGVLLYARRCRDRRRAGLSPRFRTTARASICATARASRGPFTHWRLAESAAEIDTARDRMLRNFAEMMRLARAGAEIPLARGPAFAGMPARRPIGPCAPSIG